MMPPDEVVRELETLEARHEHAARHVQMSAYLPSRERRAVEAIRCAISAVRNADGDDLLVRLAICPTHGPVKAVYFNGALVCPDPECHRTCVTSETAAPGTSGGRREDAA